MPRRRRRPAGVQALLPLEGIAGDVVRLRGGEFRAVLEASPVHFALKPEAEQEAILAGYRRFLDGLSYPLQLLVRVVPGDVEDYLEGLRRPGRASPLLRRLALDHEAFVRGIARERTLLDRRLYVVVPAAPPDGEGPRLPWRGRRPRGGRPGSGLDGASGLLALRCAEVAQALGACGVRTRRLGSPELLELWRESLGGRPLPGAGAPEPAPVVTAPARGREEARRG